MDYVLRDDQKRAVDKSVNHLQGRTQYKSLLIVSPTGSGKSFVLAEVKKDLGNLHHTVVPSLEIATGIARKLVAPGIELNFLSDKELREKTEGLGIYTAGVYKNKLLKDGIKLPSTIAFDEAHHTEARTYQGIWDMLGRPHRIGVTATEYRGTPEGTRELKESWENNIYEALSLAEAIRIKVVSLPSFSVWPLLNDDLISVVNGEFHVKTVDGFVKDKMGDLVSRVAPWFDGTHWDRPTMMAFSSVNQVNWAHAAFTAAGLPVVSVTGGTKGRQDVFARVVNREALLLQIKVVGEGVDLPLRRLIDCSPTMSPVQWRQLVGRIMRPWENVPEYIACCHNLTRHAYLFHGLIPGESIKQAQKAWGTEFKPNRRSLCRALGLDGFGKFVVSEIPLASGLLGSFYGLQTKEGSDQYAVFLHPVNPTPLFFHRHLEFEDEPSVVKVLEDGREIVGRKKIYAKAKWRCIPSLPDMVGCVSLHSETCGDPQKNWWKSSAGRFGLDNSALVNTRQFQMLPLCRDTGFNPGRM